MDINTTAEHATGVSADKQYYETPHLNELARDGVSFSRCYSMPLCTPSTKSSIFVRTSQTCRTPGVSSATMSESLDRNATCSTARCSVWLMVSPANIASMAVGTLAARASWARDEALELAEKFTAMMHGDEAPAKDRAMGDLRALQGVSKFPVRIKCALLGFDALQEAVGEGIENGSH